MNASTIEATFFSGTTKVANVKAYVQYLESLIKYTKYHSRKVSVTGWFKYIHKKPKKYKELLEVLGDINKHSEISNVVVFKEPTLIATKLNELTIGNIHKVYSIKTERSTHKEIDLYSINLRDRELSYRDEEGRRHSISISEIVELVIEED